ncbi:MAG: methylated-DNA--[protein]-cysteine S-methyltransferase [Amaricoccus sp.]
MQTHIFETVAGFCGIAWGDAGITRFLLPSGSADAAGRLLRRRVPEATPAVPTAEVAAVVDGVRRYFAGERVDFTGVRLAPQAADAFAARVYAAVRGLGWGETTTYGAVARALGAGPEAARDVGQAMARNPVPLIVPCHRVLAAGGALGGFSAPGGATAKRRMLALERVELEAGQTAFAF